MNADRVFNVNSLFQNGGITAGIVNIGKSKPDRYLNDTNPNKVEIIIGWNT